MLPNLLQRSTGSFQARKGNTRFRRPKIHSAFRSKIQTSNCWMKANQQSATDSSSAKPKPSLLLPLSPTTTQPLSVISRAHHSKRIFIPKWPGRFRTLPKESPKETQRTPSGPSPYASSKPSEADKTSLPATSLTMDSMAIRLLTVSMRKIRQGCARACTRTGERQLPEHIHSIEFLISL